MEKSYQRLRLIMPFTIGHKKLTKKEMAPKQVGNLLFENKEDYKNYRKIDKYIKILNKCVERGDIEAARYFNNLPDIKVQPICRNAWLEVYDLFPNSRNLIFISPDEKYDKTKDKIGSRFFNKFCFKDERGRRIKTGLEFVDPSDSSDLSDSFCYEPKWCDGLGWRSVRINKMG